MVKEKTFCHQIFLIKDDKKIIAFGESNENANMTMMTMLMTMMTIMAAGRKCVESFRCKEVSRCQKVIFYDDPSKNCSCYST